MENKYKTKIKEMRDELKNDKDSLNSQLSILDKKVQDILHHIEFTKLSASKGYEAYSMLKKTLNTRREVKNNLTKLTPIYQSIVDKLKYFDDVNKSYQVKVMREEFGRFIKSD